MNLTDLVRDFGNAPQPWREGRTIPWEEPGFSRRMLKEHLSQLHDAASRRAELIGRHIDFIRRVALEKVPARILDLGCGPGLYCHRLASLGHECAGIDIGPASIEYAQTEATRLGLDIRFDLADIRSAELGSSFDLVMLLFGELNPFERQDALMILRRSAAALAPGGRLLLEVSDFDFVRNRGESPPKWSVAQSGLFSDQPYIRCDESFWHEASGHAMGRHWIVDAASAEVSRFGWTMRAYTDEEYEALLTEAGLKLAARYDSLLGEPNGAGLPVLLATKA